MKELIEQYRRLSAEKEAAVTAFDEQLTALRQQIEAKLREAGVKSMRTDVGTAFLSVRRSAKVSDLPAFLGWVKESGRKDLVKLQPDTSAIAAEMAEGHVVPGAEMVQSEVLSIRGV